MSPASYVPETQTSGQPRTSVGLSDGANSVVGLDDDDGTSELAIEGAELGVDEGSYDGIVLGVDDDSYDGVALGIDDPNGSKLGDAVGPSLGSVGGFVGFRAGGLVGSPAGGLVGPAAGGDGAGVTGCLVGGFAFGHPRISCNQILVRALPCRESFVLRLFAAGPSPPSPQSRPSRAGPPPPDGASRIASAMRSASGPSRRAPDDEGWAREPRRAPPPAEARAGSASVSDAAPLMVPLLGFELVVKISG